MNTDLSDIIWLVLGVLFAVSGLASLVTHKVYMMNNAGKYTDESLRKYATPLGVSNLIIGAGEIACYFMQDPLGNTYLKTGFIPLVIGCVIGGIILFCSRKILVKK